MFDIGNIVGGIAKAVLPSVIAAEFPITALIPGLNNMIADMVGDLLDKALDQCLQQGGMPKFQINDVLNILKQVCQGQQQPCDRDVRDHCQSQFGGAAQSLVEKFIEQFKDAFQNYCDDKNKVGGNGGKPGASKGGPVTIRELAAILGELEQKQAEKVKEKADAAVEALGVSKEVGEDGKLTQEQSDKNQATEQSQFKAMEDLKAESQIFQALSSAINDVMKNFGGALNTAARGG